MNRRVPIGLAVRLTTTVALLLGCSLAQETPPRTETKPAAQPAAQDAPTAAPSERPRPTDAKALFALFRAMTGLEASFTEQKHLALLARPLRSKGRLFFHRPEAGKPGYLARVVDEPEPSSVRITPDELRMTNRDGSEVVDLRHSDDLRAFVTTLVRVFEGDEATLAKAFAVTYAKDATDELAWSLRLVPKEKPLTQMLGALVLAGRGEAVSRIEVEEPNRDRTVTTIVAADPRRVFTPQELQQLFGIAPK